MRPHVRLSRLLDILMIFNWVIIICLMVVILNKLAQ
jgi:hypothetical protein